MDAEALAVVAVEDVVVEAVVEDAVDISFHI